VDSGYTETVDSATLMRVPLRRPEVLTAPV
jgi:hypothetical protein